MTHNSGFCFMKSRILTSPEYAYFHVSRLYSFCFSIQILFISGLAFIIGLERTFRFFFQRHKLKATGFFMGGVFTVLFGWPMIGMLIELYGFYQLFRLDLNIPQLSLTLPCMQTISRACNLDAF